MTPAPMTPAETARWVALAAAERLDMAALGRLHVRWPDPARALAALTGPHSPDLRGIVGPAAGPTVGRTARRFTAEDVSGWLARNNAVLVGRGDRDWPVNLEPAEEWPAALTMQGELRSGPAVAIVGMRRCSANGASFARSLAADLAREGVTVVSGLAFGIDAAAHRGSLDGHGHTVAVIAGGLARISPRSHCGLAADIVAAGGALVSHVPPECDSPGWRFPIRNRLVAGLGDVVVVVEAAASGGALSTARHARDLGRPLLAVPGFPWDEHSAGTVALLADGAEVCRGVDDVLVALGLARSGVVPSPGTGCGDPRVESLDTTEAALLAHVEFVPTAIEDVARRADLPLVTALAGFGRLEMAGLVHRPQPGTVQRSGPPS